MSPLIGRSSERLALERALHDATAGLPTALVLRGPDGCGRSALLDWTSTSARGFARASLVATPVERELAWSGLAQLVGDVSDVAAVVPEPQARALGMAVGHVTAAPGEVDPLLVGLAVLGTLRSRSRLAPILWTVDDAQVLDARSAEILAFVAGRLTDERVLLLLAERSGSRSPALESLPTMTIGPLADADAAALLRRLVPGLLQEEVIDRIVDESGGWPGRLTQVHRGSTAVDLAGGYQASPRHADLLSEPLRRRVAALPEAASRLLLIAALDPTGSPDLLRDAAVRLGVRQRWFETVEDAGLLRLGERVTFTDAHLRAHVAAGARAEERRRAHRALWRASTGAAAPWRLWHRAAASSRPSERLARALERGAEPAREEGGAAAEAALLVKAATATPGVGARARRSLAAAEALQRAGAPKRALELLRSVDSGALDVDEQLRARRVRAISLAPVVDGPRASEELVATAREWVRLRRPGAARLFLEAIEARWSEGGRPAPAIQAIAAEAVEVDAARLEGPEVDVLLAWFAGDPVSASTEEVEQLVSAGAQLPGSTRWACLMIEALLSVWHDDIALTLCESAVRERRETGRVAQLPWLLSQAAVLAVGRGDLITAGGLVDEASIHASASGVAPAVDGDALLRGWCASSAAAGGLPAQPTSRPLPAGVAAEELTALLVTAAADTRWSLASTDPVDEVLGIGSRLLVERTESAVRSGHAECDALIERLRRRASRSGSPVALGLLGRCEALAAPPGDRVELLAAVVRQLQSTGQVLETARAHLLLGELLEAQGAAGSGEAHLDAALEAFTAAGADGFRARARRARQSDARAAASAPVPRAAGLSSEAGLTEREHDIATLVIEGWTNPEIAEQLGISRRTVEYHLQKVFKKLGVGNRHTLRDRSRGGELLANDGSDSA